MQKSCPTDQSKQGMRSGVIVAGGASVRGDRHDPRRTCRDADEPASAGSGTGRRHPERTDGRYAVVVACYMPFVDPELRAYLFETVDAHDAVVPRLESE